jgi:hypothetical protein
MARGTKISIAPNIIKSRTEYSPYFFIVSLRSFENAKNPRLVLLPFPLRTTAIRRRIMKKTSRVNKKASISFPGQRKELGL